VRGVTPPNSSNRFIQFNYNLKTKYRHLKYHQIPPNKKKIGILTVNNLSNKNQKIGICGRHIQIESCKKNKMKVKIIIS
jgi:hypothetical protein